MNDTFQIDEDIRNAHKLPSAAYCDQAVCERANERVFARSWQLVGDVPRLKAPGHIIPFTYLDGSVGEPVVPGVPLHEWGPLFFWSLDPMCDFDAWIRPVRERVARLGSWTTTNTTPTSARWAHALSPTTKTP